MSAVVIRADARSLPLPDGSVDLICTSPPYFGLRSYTDGGEHYAGQIGSEATPAQYVAALLECTREWVRVLKPSGSMFINLGDKYGGTDGSKGGTGASTLGGGRANGRARDFGAEAFDGGGRRAPGIPKCLLGLPWRYALACMDDLGLILRAEIIWAKPNGLPESVTDRVRRSHEQVFHFTRQPRYYSAVDEVREPHEHHRRDSWDRRLNLNGHGPKASVDARVGNNPLGKLPGSVWEIPSQPLTVPARLGTDHFAAFPMELPRRVIAGWSPPGICTACGEGRRPVIAYGGKVPSRAGAPLAGTNHARYLSASGRADGNADAKLRTSSGDSLPRREAAVTGYACACPQPDAPTRPAIVADPFGGTGTTALVADALGRHGLSFDRSADYCRLARWRTTDPGERARALQVPKPPPVMDGQGALFA